MQKLKRFYPVASGLLSDKPVPLVNVPPVVLASDVAILEALCEKRASQVEGAKSAIVQMTTTVNTALALANVTQVLRFAAKCHEIEQLKAESTQNSELWNLLHSSGSYYLDPPDGGDVPLLEQLRRMSADAAKWRKWLSEGKCDD